jgi:diaminopimelate epimerase
VRVDMGEPKLERGLIPMSGDPNSRAVNEVMKVGEKIYHYTGVNIGNPHCVIFMDEVDSLDLKAEGQPIELHPLYPCKTNVEFVEVIDSQTLRMRVWERGAGITLACGTGTCASVVAAVLNGKTGRKVQVHLDGGDLQIEWCDNNHVYKTGPATEVFRGEYFG